MGLYELIGNDLLSSSDPFGLQKDCFDFKGSHKKTGATFAGKVCVEFDCEDSIDSDGENPKVTIKCKTNASAWQLRGFETWADARIVMASVEPPELDLKKEKCPECKAGMIKQGSKGKLSGKVKALVTSSYQMWSGRDLVLKTDEDEKSWHEGFISIPFNCCGCKDLCEG